MAIVCSTVSWHHKTLMTSSNINDAVLKYSFLFGFDYFLFVFCSSGSYFSFKLSWYLTKENLINNLGNKNVLVLHFHPDITLRALFLFQWKICCKWLSFLDVLMQFLADFQQSNCSEKFCKFTVFFTCFRPAICQRKNFENFVIIFAFDKTWNSSQ